jgi:ParB family chromosome partitioning protein
VQKQFSASVLIRGIIEEVDIYRISLSTNRTHDLNLYGDSIDELILSIQQYGLLHPIIVRTINDSYEIVAGNRRYLACKRLGWRKVLCHILEVDDKEAFEISLIENIQRKKLSPVEEGEAFKEYVTIYGWGGISELASKICKSISYISKRMALLELPMEIIESINKSNMKNSVAEELLYIKDKSKQIQISRQIIQKNMSVREVRYLLRKDDIDMPNPDMRFPLKDTVEELDAKAQRTFDKSITTLKIALNKLGTIITNVEDNWIVYEILMQHKNMLNNQIDILIKEKKKL